jgi:hypothetical protein
MTVYHDLTASLFLAIFREMPSRFGRVTAQYRE